MEPITRIRGRALMAIREQHFQLFPLCVMCKVEGRVTVALELDHIVSLEDGGPDFDCDAGDNRQGLCIPCHREKTAKDRGYKAVGCDGSGMPTSPRHPWNRKK